MAKQNNTLSDAGTKVYDEYNTQEEIQADLYHSRKEEIMDKHRCSAEGMLAGHR